MQWVIIDDHLYVKGENGLSASIFHTFTFSLVVCRSIIVEQTINIGHSAMKIEQQYSDIPNISTFVDESRKRKSFMILTDTVYFSCQSIYGLFNRYLD